jgi:ferric-dicitrate binding protein FerR (iron transport regulator)
MSDAHRLRFLFDKYLKQQCSDEEVEELVKLLHNADNNDALVAPMQELWERIKNRQATNQVDWEKMYTNISGTKENNSASYISQTRSHKQTWMKAAAAMILLIGISGTFWYLASKKTRIPNQVAIAEPIAAIKTQQPNQTQTIHLPDGSTVILNAESKLNYPSSFAGKSREVFLTGEGYFDIKHNPNQPFLVHTGKITIRVLGTAFDIKAYPSDKSVEVTVTRGKVQVLNENKSLGLITANQQISFSKITAAVLEKTVDTKPILAWKPSEIIFNDITMLEAAKKIEQKFNTTVEFANPAIKDCRVSATFSEDDMLEEMLTVICEVTKSNYAIAKNKIVIDGKGCNE